MKKKANLQQRVSLLEEQLKRALADYQNLEKRIRKETERWQQDRFFHLADKLLGVLDNLERAEKHLQDPGLKMAVNQFRKVLASEGIEEIKSDGEVFNPETMDCVAVVTGPKDVVVETLSKGYSLNNVVIRPAKVKVGSGKKKGGKK